MQACPAGLLPQLEQGGLVERLAVLGRGAGPTRQNTNSSCEKSWHAQNYALRLLHHQSEPTASNQPSQRQPLISRYVLRLRPSHAPLRLLSLPSLRCLPDPRTLANATERRSSLRHPPSRLPIMSDAIQERLKKLGQGARIGESAMPSQDAWRRLRS